ncbi:triosephosphate isomerase [Desulfolithobacter dissulfuricans]|uniref:Triosephosphate isomerase n=1 Tax=Desulfolithobacter dissulfuricans TaxID=2795293 RepID=A0A915U2W4_9BACT|nr:triose-phosphate isomerase [Desulfolithobacter dissulfuricans]BCO10338.1 triosephosphate isomerase [Desulfolithobacter dissulfuricans]
MERRPLIAGNWKMHLTSDQAVALARTIADAASDVADRDVMIAPAFTSLPAVAEVLADSPVLLGAQNVAWEEQGAFTGEVSPVMLREFGVSLVIVGHSERRHIFGETDDLINRRLCGALRFGLVPILCVGETLEDREDGITMQILEQQVRSGLAGVEAGDMARVVIAYEPVWAIGTGKTASKEQAQEAHRFIRSVVGNLYEKKLAQQVRILYGGSVKPENVDSLMAEPDIDGALVGGAALKSESFARIIHFI